MNGQSTLSFFEGGRGEVGFFFFVPANMQLGKCFVFRSCTFHDSCHGTQKFESEIERERSR